MSLMPPRGWTSSAIAATTTVDLGTLGGTYSAAAAIDGDNVVGRSTVASGEMHAFVYRISTGVMRDLGTLGGATSYATAVSGNLVVGGSSTQGDVVEHPFAYSLDTGVMTDLGVLPNATGGIANAVAGNTIVGYAYNGDPRRNQAFTYDWPAKVLSPLLVAGPSSANAISGSTVVGIAATDDRTDHQQAFAHYPVSDNGYAHQNIGTIGGDWSVANGISGNTVVGRSTVANSGYDHAFAFDLQQPETMIQDLGSLGGRLQMSEALAVDGDLVAGRATDNSDTSHAFVFNLRTSTMEDLTPTGYVNAATGVDAQHVVGYSDQVGTGEPHAVMWTIPSLSKLPPSKPLAVTRTPGSSSVTSQTLSWSPPADPGTSAITGYRVARSAGGTGGTAWSTTLPATARSQTFTNLTAGPYTLSVSAINADGIGPATSIALSIGSPLPSPPTNVAGTALSGTSATLTWAPPLSEGSSAVTGYRVSRDGGTAGGTSWSSTVATTTRSQTFANLSAGSTYTLSIAAINAQGTGSPISVKVTMPAGAVPSAPTTVVGKPVSSTSASITWAPPTSVGSSAITGYRVSRDGGTTGGTAWSGTVAATARSQTFTNLTAGSTYTLSVAAINSQGTGPATSVTVVPASVPSAPVIGTATPGVSGGAITATAAWSAPTSTGGSAITGYRIRALRMSSTGTVLATTTSTVQPATSRSLAMTLPQTGNYRFTAEAINSVGSSAQSSRSNQVTGR